MRKRPRRLLLSVAAAIVALLCSQAGADPVAKMVGLLRSASDYKRRLMAAIGLAKAKKDRRALDALVGALKDKHHIVRGTAARALGELGDPRAKPALETLARRSKDEFVRAQVKRALATLARPARAPGKPSDEMQVEGTLGTLDAQDAQDGVNARLSTAMGCFNRVYASAPFLGGKMGLKFRVATDGTVRWLRLDHSDLGSYTAERCILQAMQVATFAKPEGGEAEFSIPLTYGNSSRFSLLDPVRSRVAKQLKRRCKKLLAGESREPITAPADLLVTLYLDAEGIVLSVGFSASGGDVPAAFAERFTTNLKQLELESDHEGEFAKLSYRFSCPTR